MKKKIIILVVIVIALILLVPIPMHLKDGGTIEYNALLYKISKVHRLSHKTEIGYEDGIVIEILGKKIYDNVIEEETIIDENHEESEIRWDEITEDGVNEEMLFENVDIELLTQIATELQSAVTEETEDERKNPEIVITEGWTRIFDKEQYKKVLNMGKSAMKPLYLILYKSPNAGEYEYLCAKILYDLSGFDFYWTNSREFLEKFNAQIIEEKIIRRNYNEQNNYN